MSSTADHPRSTAWANVPQFRPITRSAAAVPGGGQRLRDLPVRRRWIAVALALAVSAPFLVAALQAHADGWYPIADDGTMLTIARQVFSEHPPLTGEVTSLDRYGIRAYHPGPLVFYVLAPFVALLGDSLGLLIGAAVVSVTAIVLIGYVALRTAGPGAALGAWATALLMVWSLGGTAFFYRPFKTVSALLVILLFLHLSVALAVGRSTMLPLWVAAASYPVAASVRNVVPIALVGAATLVLVAVRRWPASRGESRLPPRLLTRARRVITPDRRGWWSIGTAALVAAACWWGPAYEALTNDGGNVRQLYRGLRAAAGPSDGFVLALGELARGSLMDPIRSVADRSSGTAVYIVPLMVVVGVAAVTMYRKRAPLGPVPVACSTIALTAFGAMLFVLASTPTDEGFGPYRILGASPVGAFLVFALGLVFADALAPSLPRPAAWHAVGVVGVLAVALAIALPGPIQASREDYPWAYAATRALVDEAAPQLQGEGPWAFYLLGGASTPTVFVGFKAGLGVQGVDIGAEAGAPGLGGSAVDGAPPSGAVIVMPGFLPGPAGNWATVAEHDPAGRSEADAQQVAERLVDFATDTHPLPLDTLVGALPTLLCPELVVSVAGTGPSECPEAQRILASDNPVAELPPGLVALTYLTQFGELTSVPVIDGPAPPAELLEDADRYWDDIPLAVYARRTAGS